MSNLTESLRLELAELEREVQYDPRFLKIARIKELLLLYTNDEVAHQAQNQPVTAARLPLTQVHSHQIINGVHVGSITNVKLETKGVQIKAAIRSLLSSGQAVHRNEILSHLTQLGLMGREKTPMANLAAYLSDWRAVFASDGRGNFSLKNQSEIAQTENGPESHISDPSEGPPLFG